MDEQIMSKSQKINLQNRKYLNVTGVRNVISFDVKEVRADTELGKLIIKGEDMHVKKLSRDKGELDVEGKISGMNYEGDGKTTGRGGRKYADSGKKESILSRIFG